MLANAAGMMRFLCYTGHLLKDFAAYALGLSRQVRAASLATAESAGGRWSTWRRRRCRRRGGHGRSPSGVREGLIAVLTAAEPCWSYNIRSDGEGKLELFHSYRKCHGLLHKVPHSHRYMVSDKGRKVIAALHAAREADIGKLTKAE